MTIDYSENDPLLMRPVGLGGVSKSTAVAIENYLTTVSDSNTEAQLLINIDTLARNALATLKAEEQAEVTPLLLAATVAEEMNIIQVMFKREDLLRGALVFYHYELNNLVCKLGKYALTPEITQSKTQRLKELCDEAMGFLIDGVMDNFQPPHIPKIFVQTNTFKWSEVQYSESSVVTLLTHDYSLLLDRPEIINGSFYGCEHGSVESFTGRHLKWYELPKKLFKVEKPLPFNQVTATIMGLPDVIKPQHKTIRYDLITLAERCQWGLHTSTDMMLRDMENSEFLTLKKFLFFH